MALMKVLCMRCLSSGGEGVGIGRARGGQEEGQVQRLSSVVASRDGQIMELQRQLTQAAAARQTAVSLTEQMSTELEAVQAKLVAATCELLLQALLQLSGVAALQVLEGELRSLDVTLQALDDKAATLGVG